MRFSTAGSGETIEPPAGVCYPYSIFYGDTMQKMRSNKDGTCSSRSDVFTCSKMWVSAETVLEMPPPPADTPW